MKHQDAQDRDKTFFEQEEYVSRIHLNQEKMSATERRISDYLLENGDQCKELSINELSQRTGASVATIVRFCKTLGYSGFADMKFHMQQGVLNIVGDGTSITTQDSINSIKQKAMEFTRNSIRDSIMNTDNSALEAAIDAIVKAKRVNFFGCGSAGGVALLASSLFMTLGIPSFSTQDSVLQMRTAAYLQTGDVAVGINYDGYMKEIGDALMVAKKAGATTVLITSCHDSLLARYADIILNTATRNTANALNISTTSICQLATIQTLQIGVWLRLNCEINPKMKQLLSFTDLKRYDYKVDEIEFKRVRF